eukprot:TRINITY_DN627_c0_g2_i1.p1 TRINITY_DN627_c0_g2~~TRINITY_DN627_c0_g2_i1.p1  ORF type:complete len:442 (-),score=33.34 TRINITY_DN627_c0_g2_i1:36-1220(-)
MTYPAHLLELSVKGIEKVKWEEEKDVNIQAHSQAGVGNQQVSSDVNIHERIKQTFKERKPAFLNVVPIYAFPEGSIFPGQYQFPFSFNLPDWVPGTFFFEDPIHRAKVRYSLKVTLHSGMAETAKYKTKLIVRQKPKNINTNQRVSNQANLCVCCVGKGSSRLEGWFERDAYIPGESANAMIAADNSQGELDISSFSIKLFQKINFRTGHGPVKALERIVAMQDYPGVPAGQKTTESLSLQLRDMNPGNVKYEFNEFQGTLQPTVYGSLVECSYSLLIHPYFSGTCTCCSGRPLLHVPLFLFAPCLPNYGKLKPPPNWAPKIYPAQTVVLSAPSISMNVGMPGVSVNAGGMGMQVNMGGTTTTQVNMGAPQAQVSMNVGMPSVSMEVNANQQLL